MVFILAVMEALASKNRLVSKAALVVLEAFVVSFYALKDGNEHREETFSKELAQRVSHCCYKAEWQHKSGGCAGIMHLTRCLPLPIVRRHEILFLKALLFVLRVTPNDALPPLSACI